MKSKKIKINKLIGKIDSICNLKLVKIKYFNCIIKNNNFSIKKYKVLDPYEIKQSSIKHIKTIISINCAVSTIIFFTLLNLLSERIILFKKITTIKINIIFLSFRILIKKSELLIKPNDSDKYICSNSFKIIITRIVKYIAIL